MHILIADPDPSSRVAVSRLAAAWGYDPVCVPDGAAALSVLSGASSPRLALLAWEMPGAGGLEVCKALRATEGTAASRYIALTTEERGSPEVSWALEAGADDVLPTPPEPARLRATLQAGRRIVELQSVLEERDRLRQALVQARSICHDLNQPLQVARGWADIVLEDVLPDDPNRAALEAILSSVDLAGELARRFQALARTHTHVNGLRPLVRGEVRAPAAH